MITRRYTNRLKYWVERMLVRGAGYRLLFIAALIGLVSIVGGLSVLSGGGFGSFGEAVWWAFLRLTDPGYLGDDEGALLRTVSTVITILGYVLFLGALIAIMTQWLNQTLRKLESGITPIAATGHVLVLGWTNRTPSVVAELLLAEGRVRRFLRRRGIRKLRIVVLAEEVDAALVQDLRDRLGDLWEPNAVVFRSGNPLRREHLERVDFMHAAAVVVPGAEFALAPGAVDTRTVKTLLSIGTSFAKAAGASAEGEMEPPLVVSEIFDARKISIALAAYPGDIEILGSDAMVSRLIAQNVRHSGLSRVYGELLSHGTGNEIYIRECGQFEGARLQDLLDCFPDASLLGVVRPHGRSYRPILNPPPDFRIDPGDRLVLLARSYEDSAPLPGACAAPITRAPSSPPPLPSGSGGERSILLLGWSHKVPSLLREFDSYTNERFRMDILSTVPLEERQARLARHDLHPERIRLNQIEGDYTVPSDLRRVDPATFDNVVMIGSDWLESGEESDARTILGYLLLRDLLPEDAARPDLLLELMDPGNVALFNRRAGEVLISPVIISHMLAQVALRRELRSVFDELFGPGGAEIFFRSAADFDLAGRETSFSEVKRAAAERGESALGVRLADAGGRLELNPPSTRRWTLGEEDDLIVLTTY